LQTRVGSLNGYYTSSYSRIGLALERKLSRFPEIKNWPILQYGHVFDRSNPEATSSREIRFLNKKRYIVGARPSPLSQAQVREVFQEMKLFHPDVVFQPLWIASKGDKDKKSSLKNMPKDDFFTFEIDQALLDYKCDIAIHSAKDLPRPIHDGLSLIALTKGLDPRDSLILGECFTIETLKKGAKIGCSSNRREQACLSLRSDLIPVDIRGTIAERIALFKKGEIDGLIVAEAALIRLNITTIHRIILDIPVDPLQGRLAVLGRKDDAAMRTLFQCINS
jgi:hydroxymethylbilane synthase